MKNKRAIFNDGSKAEGLVDPQVRIKNREQLRKKLKGLLENNKSLTVLLKPKKDDHTAADLFKPIRKKTSKKSALNKKGKQVNKLSVNKSTIAKQNTMPNLRNKSPNKNFYNPSIKRKSKDDLEVSNSSKTAHISQTPPRVENNSRIHVQKTTNHKKPSLIRKSPLSTKRKKKISAKSKLPQRVQLKKKIKLIPKQKSTENQVTIVKKKNIKKKEHNVTPNKGPLRPETPDDKMEPEVKHFKISPPHEKALSRLAYDDNNDTDEMQDSQDDDYYSQDYDSSENSETDSDVSYSSESTSENCLWYNSESDRTYELPEDVAEDVYVANGTAVMHDLSETNEVNFDSDNSTAQIIEIPTVRKTEEISTSTTTLTPKRTVCKQFEETYESDDSCPELVPIYYRSHLNNDSESELYSNRFDCSSIDLSDIDSVSDTNEDTVEPPQMTPAIFQCDKAVQQDFNIEFLQTVNDSPRKYITGSPLDRIVNITGNTSSYKVITTNNQVVSPVIEVKVPNETIDPWRERRSPNYANLKQPKLDSPSNDLSSTETHIRTIKFTDFKSPSTRGITDRPKVSVQPSNTESKTSPKNTSRNEMTCRTLFFNAVNSNQVIVLLKEPLYVYGTVKLKLIAGSLDVFGYCPKQNEALEIYSPRGYSSLKIEPTNNLNLRSPIDQNELLSLNPFFIRTDLQEVIKQFDSSTDAIVILERNDRSRKVNMLRKYMVEHLFPNMNSIQSDRPFYTSEFLLRCILTTKSDKPLIVDPRWKTITITNNRRVMVIGGKSVGKSTLVRYLVNRNLNKYPKILLIDLDIGQPEIFIPQTVSATTISTPLLGPGYFLNKEPDKAFLVGHTNIVLLPQKYIENVQALIEYCETNARYRDIPWIVNTMGYNKGFGDELIEVICNLVQPTNIVQLESNKEVNNFDLIMSKDNLQTMQRNIIGDMFDFTGVFFHQHHLTLLTSVIPNDKKYQKEWDMNPRDMRLAIIVSRLSNILKGHAEWLTDIKPVCASTNDVVILNLGDDQINTKDLLQTLVGNLIYLCKQGSPGESIECLGIGIVRGIDYPLKQIYLLPAVPLEVLRHVNCLAICGIPLPSSILINQGPKVKGVASYVYNTVDKAASMHIKQIYNRPQHFLTGRHKSAVH